MNSTPSNRLTLAVLINYALLLGLVVFLVIKFWPDQGIDPNATPRDVVPRGDLAADEKTNIDIFKRVSPSIVNIDTVALRRDFFEITKIEGAGSGFVWDDKGHVVTNFHVIENAQVVYVTLADRSRWKVALPADKRKWLVDRDKDLAVLRISAPKSKLHPISIGKSSNLQVGQKVYAIGNPFGLNYTFTT